VVHHLVEQGVSLDSADPQGFTPTELVCRDLAQLHATGHDDDAERVEFLSEAALVMGKIKPQIVMDILDATEGSVPGTNLAIRMIEQEVDMAAEESPVTVKRPSDGATVLHCAAKAGVLSVVRAVVPKVANINECNAFMQTPLILAAYNGHQHVVQFLTEAGADTNMAGGQFLTKMTALHEAALRGSSDVCTTLIEAKANVDARAYWGRTPLHFAVFGGDSGDESGRLECVEALIQGGADINMTDLDGETGLSYAVERSYENISELLLSKGADPCGADVHGTTPIHHCIERHNSTLFNKLLESNPGDVERLGLLPWAVRAGWKEGVNALTQPVGILSVTPTDAHTIGQAFIGGWMCPLWNAAYFNQIGDGNSLAEVFLTQTNDIDVKDHAGNTLLHRLVHWGGDNHSRFIKTLLKAGASTTIKNKQNFTALSAAVRIGNEKAIAALIDGGASITKEEVDAAASRGDPGSLTLLKMGLGSASAPDVPPCNTSTAASVIQWCQSTGLKFTDPDFPPDLTSLQGGINASDTAGRYHDVEWVRAQEACAGALLGPNDAVCGQMGDPFFVATLPDDASSAFGEVISVCAEGVYEVTLAGGDKVVVDDFVPAVDGQPQFTKSTNGLMWPLIYEKACAKKAGCYDALSAIRRGQAAPNTPDVKLPAVACPSARRAFAVKEFLGPALSGAAISRHDNVLSEFAQYFMEQAMPSVSMDGNCIPFSSVGNYEKFSFPLRTPAQAMKINSYTNLHVTCERQADAADGKMVVCICEAGEHAWRLVAGKVADDDVLKCELDVALNANPNDYILFCGTPANTKAFSDIELTVEADTAVDFSEH
jgi:ankyrin repeat protein